MLAKDYSKNLETDSVENLAEDHPHTWQRPPPVESPMCDRKSAKDSKLSAESCSRQGLDAVEITRFRATHLLFERDQTDPPRSLMLKNRCLSESEKPRKIDAKRIHGGAALDYQSNVRLGATPVVPLPADVLELCRTDLVNPGLPWVTDSA